MQIASADDPVKATQEHREKNAAANRDYRERKAESPSRDGDLNASVPVPHKRPRKAPVSMEHARAHKVIDSLSPEQVRAVLNPDLIGYLLLPKCPCPEKPDSRRAGVEPYLPPQVRLKYAKSARRRCSEVTPEVCRVRGVDIRLPVHPKFSGRLNPNRNSYWEYGVLTFTSEELTIMPIQPRTLGVPTAVHSEWMAQRWLSRGNALSQTLQATWAHICQNFNLKLQTIGRSSQRDWYVCSPATGTGKTESLKVYAALFPRFVKHSGMLAVTRLKVSADEIRNDINELAGKIVATAYHTDSGIPLEDLKDYPVLVITHAAFARAMERAASSLSKWDHFTAFGESGKRHLIVIDEAIDVLDLTTLTEDQLSQTIGAIPRTARDEWPAAVSYMEDLLLALRQWDAAMKGQGSEAAKVIRTEDQAAFARLFYGVPEFSGLREFMRTHRHVGSRRRGTGEDASTYLGKEYAKGVAEVEALAQNFMLHHKRNRRASLSTARCILPDDSQGCVVLDATASTNRLYDIMSRDEGMGVHMELPPAGARTYRNLTVKIARVSGTGKRALTAEDDEGQSVGKAEASRLLSWLGNAEEMRKHSEVFLACHMDNEVHFAGAELPFALKTAHYGAIDGSNDFRTCTAGVIFGLPFRDPLDASLSFFALQGVQPDEWLSDDTRRRFREFNDIKHELWIGWTVTSLVQTVNRIATRTVITQEGDCPPCELYVMLPKGKLGDTIERRLMEQLPDAPLPQPWMFTTARTERKQKCRSTDHREALRVFIQNMEQGARFTASTLRGLLSVSPRQWDRLVSEMKDSASELAATLRARAVSYSTERQGSRTVAYLKRAA